MLQHKPVNRKPWFVVGCVGAVALFAYAFTNNQLVTETTAENTLVAPLEKSTWKLFKPKNELFEILMPSMPQHVTEKHPNGKDYTNYDVYLSQDHSGSVFLISVTEYPKSYEMGSDDDLLEAVKNGALGSNSKNKLKEAERTTYLNLPALDFSIENNEYAIRSKAIVKGRTLYVLTVMDRDSSRLGSDFSTFAGSFVLKQ